MVSFSCEACGDVLTKKKLDAHRSHCRGASFTCLDCMVHFHGTEYRSHTSCITEDQKYQGALYREKPGKRSNRKSVSIVEPGSHNAIVPRSAYVEDAAETEAIPPAVPTPPSAVRAQPTQSVNVFDFLVGEESPNHSRVSLGGSHEQMSMKKDAPSVFSDTHSSKSGMTKSFGNDEELDVDENYEKDGYSYGAEPIVPTPYRDPHDSLVSLKFTTPAAKPRGAKTDPEERPTSAHHSRTNSATTSDKKRKRSQPEELDTFTAVDSDETHTPRYELEGDTLMPDIPTRASAAESPIPHTGLTGGINRLLSHPSDPFPPSPDYSDSGDSEPEPEPEPGPVIRDAVRRKPQDADPPSPPKRSRQSKEDPSSSSSGLGISIKGRAGKVLSRVNNGARPARAQPATVKHQNKDMATVKTTRRRASSSEDGQARGADMQKREKKKHKVHRHTHAGTGGPVRHEHSRQRSKARDRNDSPDPHHKRNVKAIEYNSRRPSDSGSEDDTDDHHHHRTKYHGGGGVQMVVFGSEQQQRVMMRRAESFLSLVTKGPDSERGCSVNKALKRWHRSGSGSRAEEEKELWKSLRLKRNESGEVVVFLAG